MSFSLAIFAASPGIMRRVAARETPQTSVSPLSPAPVPEPVTREPHGSDETAARRAVDASSVHGETGARVAAIRTETPLSARETEIAALLAEGKTNGETAELLFISQKTVETHLSNIFRKMRVSNRVQLVRAILAPTPEKANT